MFQPTEWAKIFKRAGAKYVVLTSKHHEGFPLWPSQHSWNWNAIDIGPHRDILGDLTKAVRESNLKMGYYYSLLEWYHPLYKKETINQYIDQHMFPQMKNLVNTYKPDVFWTDGEWDYTSYKLRSTEFLSWLYYGVVYAGASVGLICFVLGLLAISTISETHNRDLNFLEE